MSSTRLISKNLSQAPLAFFTLMAIFPPSLFNEFLFDFDVEGPIDWLLIPRGLNYKVMSVKTKILRCLD